MTLHGNCLWYPDQMVLSLLPEYADRGLDRKGLQAVTAARQAMMEATQMLQLKHSREYKAKARQHHLEEAANDFIEQVNKEEKTLITLEVKCFFS